MIDNVFIHTLEHIIIGRIKSWNPRSYDTIDELVVELEIAITN